MKRCFANIFLLLTIFCCTTEKEVFSPSTDETTENYEEPINQIINSFDEYNNDESHLSDYIYDQDRLHRFDIYITEKNLDKIDRNPAAEKYVEGHLVFENKIVKNIGVRYKGSIGAWVGCLSNEDWANPSGYKTCPKLSMKIKFNWRGNKKFYNLKKLQFHSQNLDPTKMHERLGYYMFRKFGIIAPRSNHALIYINGEFNGIFANTENIDGPFTNKHFEKPDGNLYKEVWPVESSGNSQTQDYFIGGLKTNEEASDVSKMKRFSDLLGATDFYGSKTIVNQWINQDLFLKTLVVDRRIANDDGFLHFYHQENEIFENHNYYWYEDPTEDKLQLIPWDLDNSFENLIQNLNPVTPIKDKWYNTSNECNGFRYGSFNLLQKSAACDKIIGSYKDLKDRYYELDTIFKNELFNMSNINLLLNKWSSQIETEVERANQIFGEKEPNLKLWQESVNYLKYSISESLKQ